MIYTVQKHSIIQAFTERNIHVINLDSLESEWRGEDNLRDFFKLLGKEINISYVNNIVLELPKRKLHDWIKSKKYVHLGDYFHRVEAWAIERGYCPFMGYSNFL